MFSEEVTGSQPLPPRKTFNCAELYAFVGFDWSSKKGTVLNEIAFQITLRVLCRSWPVSFLVLQGGAQGLKTACSLRREAGQMARWEVLCPAVWTQSGLGLDGFQSAHVFSRAQIKQYLLRWGAM